MLLGVLAIILGTGCIFYIFSLALAKAISRITKLKEPFYAFILSGIIVNTISTMRRTADLFEKLITVVSESDVSGSVVSKVTEFIFIFYFVIFVAFVALGLFLRFRIFKKRFNIPVAIVCSLFALIFYQYIFGIQNAGNVFVMWIYIFRTETEVRKTNISSLA